MNDQQRRGQKIMVGLILGGILFTVLGIVYWPANQQGVGARSVLFFILVLANMAGLYQGRAVPKFFALILLFGGIILGIRWLMAGAATTAITIGVIVAMLFFATFIAALLVSREVESYMELRQGKQSPPEDSAS